MNDSDNKVTKVIVGIIVAVLVIIVSVYAYRMLRNDRNVNDVKNDVNQAGQDIYNGANNVVNGTGEAIGDVANGIKDTAKNIIDFTLTENAKVENNIKTNTSEKISADKKYEELIFKEVTLIGRDNSTTFTAKIKNDSKDDFKSKNVTITFFKKDNTTITSRKLTIPNIKSGETTEITVNMQEDVANAYDYEVK